MGKPIGYFTNFTAGDGSPLALMEESWGSHFEQLNEAERAWMIYQLGYQLWQDAEGHVASEVMAFNERHTTNLDNLNKLGLIQALVEQIKEG